MVDNCGCSNKVLWCQKFWTPISTVYPMNIFFKVDLFFMISFSNSYCIIKNQFWFTVLFIHCLSSEKEHYSIHCFEFKTLFVNTHPLIYSNRIREIAILTLISRYKYSIDHITLLNCLKNETYQNGLVIITWNFWITIFFYIYFFIQKQTW